MESTSNTSVWVMKNNYRETIVKVLPFIQFAIALITLNEIVSLQPKNPMYFCRQAQDTYGNYYQYIVCEPQWENIMYSVQTWDEEYHMVRYHTVVDAIDYEDAAQVVKDLNPGQNVIGVTRHRANENQ